MINHLAVRPDQFEDEAEHLPGRFRLLRLRGRRGGICAVGIWVFHFSPGRNQLPQFVDSLCYFTDSISLGRQVFVKKGSSGL